VKLAFAWQSLVHDKMRAAVSIGGVSFSILLVFVQLGLYDSVYRTATLVQDQLNYDIVLLSPDYLFLAKPGTFPRRRLRQACVVPGVKSTAPLYVGIKPWRNRQSGRHWRLFVLAFRPEDHVFLDPEITKQLPALRQPDTVLLDRQTRPEFGAQFEGLVTELGRRNVEVAGQYTIGTGFLANGAVLTSDQNFSRLYDGRPLEEVNVGLVKLEPGADPDEMARSLRSVLPEDVQVLTRADQNARERQYWATQSSVGLINGFGTVVAAIVGVVILYQVLATDLTNHLPEYATLKAMGYRDISLTWLVVLKVILLGLLAYAPALPLALAAYAATRDATMLPIVMTWPRVLAVLAFTLILSTLTALVSLRKLRTADPADLY
jgi:putative ABC transport system permease protein